MQIKLNNKKSFKFFNNTAKTRDQTGYIELPIK